MSKELGNTGLDLKVSDNGRVSIPLKTLVMLMVLFMGASSAGPSFLSYYRPTSIPTAKVEANIEKDTVDHSAFQAAIHSLETSAAVLNLSQRNTDSQVEKLTKIVADLSTNVSELVGELRASRNAKDNDD